MYREPDPESKQGIELAVALEMATEWGLSVMVDSSTVETTVSEHRV